MGRYYDNNACILCCLAVASIKSPVCPLVSFSSLQLFLFGRVGFVPHLPTTPLQSYTPAALQVRDRCEKRKPEEQFILRQLALTMICFQPSLRPKSGGRRRCQKWIPANIKIKMSCKQTATVPSGLWTQPNIILKSSPNETKASVNNTLPHGRLQRRVHDLRDASCLFQARQLKLLHRVSCRQQPFL